MAIESFYGGNQGVSPVIKARFKYINETDPAYITKSQLTTKLSQEEAWILNAFFKPQTDFVPTLNFNWGQTCFKNGEELSVLTPFTMDSCLKRTDYTEVWYGELCIIDTESKINSNNGKIYRRTLRQSNNYYLGTEDTLYAEYVGQIVGPSGGIPRFSFNSINSAKRKALGQESTYPSDTSLPLNTNGWKYSYPSSQGGIASSKPTLIEDIATLQDGNAANINFVPGKYIENNEVRYNDNIKYTWCNVQRPSDGSEEEAWIYLGFEIPYPVFDINAESRSFDYNGPFYNDNYNSNHPFYHNLTFYVPRGLRGIGPEKIFIVGKNNQTKPSTLYNIDAIDYDAENDRYFIKNNATTINPSSSTYWVAKWTLYGTKQNNSDNYIEVYQYLGDYQDINSIQLKDNGQLQIKYSNTPNSWSTLKTLTWVTDASIDIDPNSNNYGNFILTFNNTSNRVFNINEILPLIKSISYVDNTGQITFNYATEKTNENQEGNWPITVGTIDYIKNWIIVDTKDNQNNITARKLLGTSNVSNSQHQSEIYIPWPRTMSFDAAIGKISVGYTIGNNLETKTLETVTPIAYINNIRINSDGSLSYKTNITSFISNE